MLIANPDITLQARRRARQSYEKRYAPSQDLKRLEALYAEVVEQSARSSIGGVGPTV
jgi:hypothetical protein